MELTEIKKALYKENPTAAFEYFRKGWLYYTAPLQAGLNVTFSVPVSDVGDASFGRDMEAKLLIRYITTETHSNP